MSGLVGWMRILEIPWESANPMCSQVSPASQAAVDAVARQDVAADARLAGADEDEVGVGFRHRDRAHRRRRDLEVCDGVPIVAAVGRLPEASAGRAEVGFVRASLDAGDRDGAAAPVGGRGCARSSREEGGVENDLLGGEITHGRGEEDRREHDRRDWRAFHCGASCAWGW